MRPRINAISSWAFLPLLVGLAWIQATTSVHAQDNPPGLYDRPVLALESDMHMALINRADVDRAGRFMVTGSDDKTARIWSVENGHLLQTIRVPAGPGNVGKIFAVAIDPDGDLVAAGGWATPGPPSQIYLFERSSGAMVQHLAGLPNVVLHLAFSADGRYLAAALFGGHGVRIYDRKAGWAEIARDEDYGDNSYGAAFTADGRLATTSYDGHIRLYDANFALIRKVPITGGRRPFGLAFDPDGQRLAVGFMDSTNVALLDGQSLEALAGPNVTGVNNGNLSKVAWSRDGKKLYAAGIYDQGGISPVVSWLGPDLSQRSEWPASKDSVMSLLPIADSDLLVAAGDPFLGRFDAEGQLLWQHQQPQADFRGQHDSLSVSHDGLVVDFGYKAWGASPARFDLSKLKLLADRLDNDVTVGPIHDGLEVTNWFNHDTPLLNGKPLPVMRYETSRSLAIHPDGDRFVLGTNSRLRAFDQDGELLWHDPVPGIVWSVNISGDGRLVVAAYGDGSIRWHDMEDGKELLAFLPLQDQKRWVAWAPQGYYASTPDARRVLKWHVNQGWNQAAEAVPVSEVAQLLRPTVLPLIVQERDLFQALGRAEHVKAMDATKERLNGVAPGARLHVLAIGVSFYGEQARHLKLDFAHRDAWDIANMLMETQSSIYADVQPQLLDDEKATSEQILRALKNIDSQMQAETHDVAVIHFSGHGAMVDGKLYLLPHDVNASDLIGVKLTGLKVDDLISEIESIASKGRVLILLDACHSGAATGRGDDFKVNARALRNALVGTNVSVLTSSLEEEVSREDPKWSNGAFTSVLLDALRGSADEDHSGTISMTELTDHLDKHLPILTKGRQRPGIEVRFQQTIFAVGR